MSNPRLPEIPDDILIRRQGRGAAAQAARLARWLDDAGFRPTLLDLEDERNRRKDNR